MYQSIIYQQPSPLRHEGRARASRKSEISSRTDRETARPPTSPEQRKPESTSAPHPQNHEATGTITFNSRNSSSNLHSTCDKRCLRSKTSFGDANNCVQITLRDLEGIFPFRTEDDRLWHSVGVGVRRLSMRRRVWYGESSSLLA